jgi:hypothetical protein
VVVRLFIHRVVSLILSVILFNASAIAGSLAFKEKIHFNAGIGYGNYDMKRGAVERSYYGGLQFDEFANIRIEGGREYCGELIFDYSRNFSVGAGLIYSSGNRQIFEHLQTFLDDYNRILPQMLLYKTSLSAPYLKLQYRSVLDVLDYSIGFNLYYGFASLDGQIRSVSSYPPMSALGPIYFNSKGMGYSLSLGFSYSVSKGFAINNAIGYRSLVVDDLKDSDGNPLLNLDLDFSGIFIRGGLSINPWR